MKPISDFMKLHHKMLTVMLDEFRSSKKDTPKRERLFANFASLLEKHMIFEEEVLFPLFEGKTGTESLNKSTSTLRKDHKQVRDLAEKIKKMMNNNADTDKLENHLVEILQEHEKTEFDIVYPWLDEAIGEDAAKAIIRGMKTISG